MALIIDIETTGSKERQSVHKSTRCIASTFSSPDGNVYLQLDTFGSDDRQFPEKVSQSFQFDRKAAAQLKKLLDETFPSLP
jgi:hypothetical protein